MAPQAHLLIKATADPHWPLSFSELTKPLERAEKTLVPSVSNEGSIPAEGQEGTRSYPASTLKSDVGLLGDCLLAGFVTTLLRSHCPTEITDTWGGSKGCEGQQGQAGCIDEAVLVSPLFELILFPMVQCRKHTTQIGHVAYANAIQPYEELL